MKICVILPSLKNTAPIKIVVEILANLPESIGKVDIYYFNDVVEVNIKGRMKRIKFTDSIDFDSYDIIHTHMLKPDLYVALNRKKIKKAVTITTMHQYNKIVLASNYGKIPAFFLNMLWLLAIDKIDYIIVLSNDMKRYYEKIFKEKPIQCIYNGLSIKMDGGLINSQSDVVTKVLQKKYLLIGCVGALITVKGFDRLIKYLKYNRNVVLVIIGEGKCKNKLENLARKIMVKDRCIMMGFQKEAYRYFHLFDVIAIPSRSEGFPLVILESAIFKKLTICSNIPVFQELFNKNEIGICNMDDPADIDKQIIYLLKNKDEYVSRFNSRYIKEYTSECMSKRYFDFYTEVTANRSEAVIN